MFSLPTYDKILISFLWFPVVLFISLCRYIYCYSYPLFCPAFRKLCCLSYAWDELPAHVWAKNPPTVMTGLQWTSLCSVVGPEYFTTQMCSSPNHTPIFMSPLKNKTSSLCYHCAWSRRILRSKTATNISWVWVFALPVPPFLTNPAANGKFKAAETEAVLSINKTKSCEF